MTNEHNTSDESNTPQAPPEPPPPPPPPPKRLIKEDVPSRFRHRDSDDLKKGE
jgi:hypothetical protein